MSDLAVVILAAGQGTRMRSSRPKVLHLVAGKPMVRYAVENAAALTTRPPVVVIGVGADAVRSELGDAVSYVVQEQQLGTGHAVAQARPLLEGQADLVLVCYGDMPLLRVETLRQLVQRQEEHDGPMTILTVISEDSMGFGRVVRDQQGRVREIVEEKVATPEQLRIRELNAGVYCFQGDWLWPHLDQIQISPVGEYYLTDLIGIAVAEGQDVATYTIHDVSEVQGVNTRVHLARAEAVMRKRINERWMLAGVTMLSPETIYIDESVEIGQDTVLYPNTYLLGHTVVGRECEIGPGALLCDSRVGDHCRILSSVVEEAVVEDRCTVGPYAHLRRGAHLAEDVHMGNFGEVKNSYVGRGTRMGHFGYVGDAQVGVGVNLGAGVVTCNYDGERKHQTVIEDGAFIGSDALLVAPVRIGRGARVGAGAVVTRDIPEGKLAYGVPARVRDEEKS
ncbi:MAG: bifunctional UDP-N-acetylglucosamine diphosphorylase/glucosamine-1-phosphate N-acetyltransferase GlmU [Anaerolineae bacterium]|nr:bifunctional UDP-N-acetylglucosamine diphosphorylase/glucosamine-1-phosphate N-acetyltransferase GlmU [Anaerolineae bacterium]